MSYASHDICATGKRKEGHLECSRDDNCRYWLGLTDTEWKLYGCNLQRKKKRKPRKIDKVQCESTSSEDSLVVDPADSEDTAAEEDSEMESGSLKSMVTRVSTKRIAVPWDSDCVKCAHLHPGYAANLVARSRYYHCHWTLLRHLMGPTWQHRWKPIACSNKRRTFIGSNHHSTCHWTSRCGFPDHSLCSSPLVHRAQDAVTMALDMWRMIRVVLQQQQCMVFIGYIPRTPWTPLHRNAGTPVGTPRCPGGMAMPRFPAPIPVQTTPPVMPFVAASTALPTGMDVRASTTITRQINSRSRWNRNHSLKSFIKPTEEQRPGHTSAQILTLGNFKSIISRLSETCQSLVLDRWKSGRTSEKYWRTNKNSWYNHVKNRKKL